MSKLDDFNPNVYWEVDGKKYYRNADALVASSESNSKIKFYYHNDAFDRFNWEVEPPQTFNQLCAIRAQQLRDNYKYLRLWYSGGADSHTVLRTFLDNNIHLDEIAMIRVGVIDEFDTHANVEINRRSVPYLNSIRHSIPKTKISTVDISASDYLEYYQSDDWFLQARIYDFADDAGVIISGYESIERGGLSIPDDCAEITGGDKSKLIRHDDVYYIPIVDSSFPYLHITTLEEFYITPDLPELHSKQSHVLKHLLENMFPKDQDLTHEIYNPVTGDQHFRSLWYSSCRQILNSDIDFGKGWGIITPKGQSRIVDAYSKSPETLHHYRSSLREFQQSVGDKWPELDKPPVGNIAGLYSIGKYKHE